MKITIFTIFILFLITACGKKEEVKFEAFSPEAFAYDIGDSWEVNATVNIRGFDKVKREEEYSASLSYTVELTTPDGNSIDNIFSDSLQVSDKELNYIQLEAQFELDNSYAEGTYKLLFNVVDNYSGKTAISEVEFKLEE